jgi:hypothetical protein
MKPNLLIVEIAVTEHAGPHDKFADDVVTQIEDLCVCNFDNDRTTHSFFTIATRWDDSSSPYKRCETCVNFSDARDSFGDRTGICTGFVGRPVPWDWTCADWSPR